MTDSAIVAVALFQSHQEASIAQAALAAEGIEAEVAGGVIADTMAYFGTATGGVRLLVAEADAARANELLERLASERTSAPAAPWRCPGCGEEIEGEFEVCWSCGGVRPEHEPSPEISDGETGRPPARSTAQLAGPVDRSESADRSLEPDESGARQPESPEATLDRAWRAAIFGIALPPLLVYALVLLLRAARAPTAQVSWKFYATLGIIAGMLMLWWAFLRYT